MTLKIEKETVYNDVDMTTAYIGGKSDGAALYDSVATKYGNRELLDRYWAEACSGATEKFKRFVTEVSPGTDDAYEVNLTTGNRYNEAMTDSIKTSLHAYFVYMIVCQWLSYCKKDDCETYANNAVAAMDDVMRKLYHKTAPKRVSSNE